MQNQTEIRAIDQVCSTRRRGPYIGNLQGLHVKDITLRPEGSDTEFIGVIVWDFFILLFITLLSEGLPRLVKTTIFIEWKCVQQKINKNIYVIFWKKSVDMKIYIFILYYRICFFTFWLFLLKNLYILKQTHFLFIIQSNIIYWVKKPNQVRLKNTGIAIKIVFEVNMVFIVF